LRGTNALVYPKSNVSVDDKLLPTANVLDPVASKETLGKNFTAKAIVNGQDKQHYSMLENPGIMDLYKTGIQYADAITIGSPDVDASLHKFVHNLNKPFLDYRDKDAENFAESHYEFYQSLLEDNVLANSR